MAIKNVFGVFTRGFNFLSSGGMIADVLAFIVLALIIGGIYFKGRTDANLACARASTAGLEQSIKEYGQIKKDINRMDESRIDNDLSKWMRD